MVARQAYASISVWMMEKNRRARLWNQQRLRELLRRHASDIEVFCGHDVLEFERLSGRSAEIPAEMITRPTLPPSPATRERPDLGKGFWGQPQARLVSTNSST